MAGVLADISISAATAGCCLLVVGVMFLLYVMTRE